MGPDLKIQNEGTETSLGTGVMSRKSQSTVINNISPEMEISKEPHLTIPSGEEMTGPLETLHQPPSTFFRDLLKLFTFLGAVFNLTFNCFKVTNLFNTQKTEWAACFLASMLLPSIFIILQKLITKQKWRWSFLLLGCHPLNTVVFSFMDFFTSVRPKVKRSNWWKHISFLDNQEVLKVNPPKLIFCPCKYERKTKSLLEIFLRYNIVWALLTY
jgi:hypothetical protein